MRPSHTSLLLARSHFSFLLANVLASFVFLASGILCNTALAQVPMHLLEFKKQVFGTNGDPANPVARVGETVTAIISFQNLNEVLVGFPPGTYTLTSIIDVIHHANGDEVSPNLLAAIAPVTLQPFAMSTGDNYFVSVTNTFVVRPGDDALGFLTDDARAFGFDNHDDVLGDIPLPFVPYQSAPAQIRILVETNPCPPCTNVIEAVSDSYNPGGSKHALYLPGISINLIFSPNLGSWTENPADGTATLTGRVHSRTNVDCGFDINVRFSGRTTMPPAGSPKLDLDDDVYVPDGPVDPDTWYYYPTWSGTLTGFGPCWEGAILDIVRTGPAWQVGAGANGKNINFGASGWFNWMVTRQPFAPRPPLPVTGKGDFNIDITPCPPCPPVTDCVCTNVFEAVSDSFNPGGSKHALWLPGISVNLIFSPTPGSWVENANAGTASLTGRVHSRTDVNCGFDIVANFSGRTTAPPPGSPQLDLDDDVYVPDGPVDPSTWYFYPTWSGTLKGFGSCWNGAELDIVRTGPAWQVGAGANGKNINFGASGWFNWMVTQQRFSGSPLPATGRGDFNIDIKPCPCPPVSPLPIPIALPLRVRSLELLPSSVMRLNIVGISGRSYLIEGSDDLIRWRSIATVLNNNFGGLLFIDPARTSRCFYRVKMLP